MLEDCEHDGSVRVRIEKLKSIIHQPYTRKFGGGLIAFIDRFQTSIEELGTLLNMYSSGSNKLEFLTTVLNRERGKTVHYLDYIKDHNLTFKEACAYIRERALMNYTFDTSSTTKKFNKVVNEDKDNEKEEDSFTQVFTIMQNWSTETGNDMLHVYATMNASQPLRESLMVPTKLWVKLAPDIKKAIMETKKTILASPNNAPTKSGSNTPIPRQYSNPARANNVNTEPEVEEQPEEEEPYTHIAAHATLHDNGLLYEDSSDSDDENEDENYRYANMMKHSVDVHHSVPIEVSAYTTTSMNPIAFADGGADSCIGGHGWKVLEYTGRKANLVGYDERSTKKSNLDICTLATRVQSHPEKPPIILVAHEMVYNPGSNTTLISEYQVRNNGCVIDSVSKKHRKSLSGDKGTQTFYPRDDYPVPFTLKRGLMGFQIQEPTQEEIDSLEHIVITTDHPWNPSTHSDDAISIDFHAQNTTSGQNLAALADHVDSVISKSDSKFFDPSDDEVLIPNIGTTVMCPLFGNETHHSVSANATTTWHRTDYKSLDPEQVQPYLAWRPLDVVKKTLEKTTQLAKMIVRFPLRRHVKARFKWNNVTRIQETVSTDPLFSNVKSAYDGFIGAQVFYGTTSHCINVYGIKSKGDFHLVYKDFIREHGAPAILRRDNAKEENNESVLKVHRDLLIKDEFIEPHNPQQNSVESRAIKWLKEASLVLMNRLGVPGPLWYYMVRYLADIHNICADKHLNWMTPLEKRTGITPDISPYLQFQFWEKLLVLDTEESWPASKEKPMRFLGVAHNIGDLLTFLVYDEATRMVLARSVVRPATLNK